MSLTFKRHYRLLVLLGLAVLGFGLGLGKQRIIAYSVPGKGRVAEPRVDYSNPIDLFDDTQVHTIRLILAETDYTQMITTYQQTGEKDYFHADIVIDGVRVNNVGVRLKGNASLRSAVGGGMGAGQRPGGGGAPGGQGAPGGGGPGGGMPGGGRPPNAGNRPGRAAQATPQAGEPGQPAPDNPAAAGEPPAPPEAPGANAQVGGPAQPPAGNPGGGPLGDRGAQAGRGSVKIPLLIQFDRYVSGQRYQGYARLAIRSAGISDDEAMLQEPVTNALVRAIGMPATRTAYCGLQLNEQAERLFTISEVIDEDYLEQYFRNPGGILYKAEFGARLSYQGEDPSAYAASFDQQTRQNQADLAPLIRLLRFLDQADAARFEKELPDYLDVDAFASYLAVNNLLVNTDSFAGMGNNYYLYYDDQAQRFTMLMWDGNESLGKLGNGAQGASYDLYYQGRSGPQAGGPGRGGGPGGDAGGLTQRFLATPAFKALYEQKLQSIYQAAFSRGALERQVEQYAALVRQANRQRSLVETSAYEQAVAKVLDFINQRQAYLATTPLLSDVAEQPTVTVNSPSGYVVKPTGTFRRGCAIQQPWRP